MWDLIYQWADHPVKPPNWGIAMKFLEELQMKPPTNFGVMRPIQWDEEAEKKWEETLNRRDSSKQLPFSPFEKLYIQNMTGKRPEELDHPQDVLNPAKTSNVWQEIRTMRRKPNEMEPTQRAELHNFYQSLKGRTFDEFTFEGPTPDHILLTKNKDPVSRNALEGAKLLTCYYPSLSNFLKTDYVEDVDETLSTNLPAQPLYLQYKAPTFFEKAIQFSKDWIIVLGVSTSILAASALTYIYGIHPFLRRFEDDTWTDEKYFFKEDTELADVVIDHLLQKQSLDPIDYTKDDWLIKEEKHKEAIQAYKELQEELYDYDAVKEYDKQRDEMAELSEKVLRSGQTFREWNRETYARPTE